MKPIPWRAALFLAATLSEGRATTHAIGTAGGAARVKQLEEYAKQAHDCREAAGKARTPEAKEHLLQMAERWEELARQRAAHLHLEDLLTDLVKQNNGNGGAAAA